MKKIKMPDFESFTDEIFAEMVKTQPLKRRKIIHSESITIPKGGRTLKYMKTIGLESTSCSIMYCSSYLPSNQPDERLYRIDKFITQKRYERAYKKWAEKDNK
jgi:hypothetical protein